MASDLLCTLRHLLLVWPCGKYEIKLERLWHKRETLGRMSVEHASSGTLSKRDYNTSQLWLFLKFAKESKEWGQVDNLFLGAEQVSVFSIEKYLLCSGREAGRISLQDALLFACFLKPFGELSNWLSGNQIFLGKHIAGVILPHSCRKCSHRRRRMYGFIRKNCSVEWHGSSAVWWLIYLASNH